MGSILASEIIGRAAGLLEDQSFQTWTQAQHLASLNEGQGVIVGLRPDAKTRVRSVPLVAGTRQSIAAPDLRVLDVVRNMGANGTTPGRAIRFIERRELDLENPAWHAAQANVVVRHWAYDQAVPETWWCYPPQPSTPEQVEIITSAIPTPCTLQSINDEDETTAIDISDLYASPLVDWIVFRAYSRDAEYTQPGGKADLAFRAFYQFFGIKTETDKRFRPEKANPPFFSPPPVGNQGALGDR